MQHSNADNKLLPGKVTPVGEGVYRIVMGMANAFLLCRGGELTLIDAGYPGHEATVLAAIHALGYLPSQLKHLIFTHAHPDHIGSAAAIVRETGARTYMHPVDSPIAETGGPFRPLKPAPGLLHYALCKLLFHPSHCVEPVAIDQALTPGEILPLCGGIEIIAIPGHCVGQVALLWHPGRTLFVGDLCTNMFGLDDPVGFESIEEGHASQRRVANLNFEAACFGHGAPIPRNAAERFRKKWCDS